MQVPHRHSITETVQSNLVRQSEQQKVSVKRPSPKEMEVKDSAMQVPSAQKENSNNSVSGSVNSSVQEHKKMDSTQPPSIYGTCKEWEVALSDRISQLQSRLAKLRSYNK